MVLSKDWPRDGRLRAMVLGSHACTNQGMIQMGSPLPSGIRCLLGPMALNRLFCSSSPLPSDDCKESGVLRPCLGHPGGVALTCCGPCSQEVS